MRRSRNPISVRRQEIAVPEKALWIGAGVAALMLFGPQLARWLARNAVATAYNIPVQTVIGAAEAIGIPPTDPSLCEQYKAADDVWNASFYCTATDFLKWYWWERSSLAQRMYEQPATATVPPASGTGVVPDATVIDDYYNIYA